MENWVNKRVTKRRGKTAIIAELPCKNELVFFLKSHIIKKIKKGVSEDSKFKSIKEKKKRKLLKKKSI